MSLPACITLRTVKGSVLSWGELDNNFVCLNNSINSLAGLVGNGNRWHIPSGTTLTIETDYQHFIYGDMVIEGVLQLSGNSQLVVLNGNIILSGGSTVGSGTIYNIQLPGFDTKVTGVTYTGDVLTIYQNDGTSYSASVVTSVDISVTGGTYNPVTGVATFYDNVGGNFPISGFLTGYTDVQVSDLNYVGQTLVLNQTNGTSFSATTPSFTFTGNTSGDCITDLFVSNVNSCSPLHIQPINNGDVYISENGGNVGINTVSPTAQLHIKGIDSTSSNYGLKVQDSGGTDSFVVRNDGNVGIGTSTPQHKVHISGDGFITNNNAFYFATTNRFISGQNYASAGSAGNNALLLYNSDGSNYYFVNGNSNNASHHFQSVANGQGTTKTDLIIKNDGNVGIGTSTPTKKLQVNGDGLFSSSTSNVLTIIGSGSSTSSPLFSVQGSSGQLFSISDSLIGSLFSVNDISGLPVLEAFSNSTILMGDYNAPSLNTTKKVSSVTGSTTIYSIPTSAYTGAFYDYTINDGTNFRSGNVMSVWSGSTAQYIDSYSGGVSAEIGSTTGLTFSVSINSEYADLVASVTTSTWTIKTIIRSI